MNLSELQRVAEAATPGPWHHRMDGRPELNNQKDIVEARLAGQSDVDFIMISYGMPVGPNAAHIAAFDPPTVLKLLAIARAAPDAVDALTAGLTHTLDKFHGGETADSLAIRIVRDALRQSLEGVEL